MGVTGFDWNIWDKQARSQISSMTLIHGGKFVNGNIYNNMEVAGLLATSEVAVA